MVIISDFESEDTGSIPVFPTNTQKDKTSFYKKGNTDKLKLRFPPEPNGAGLHIVP